ncbi:hypothetical protein GZH46_01044, partial [Fragariocoptes setiger]
MIIKSSNMVFISFSDKYTEEENALKQKYEKLKRKPEPTVAPSLVSALKRNAHDVGAKDAKKVIESLKRTGALPQIKIPEQKVLMSGFKRSKAAERIGASKPPPAKKPDRTQADLEKEREVVSYEDVF